MRFPAWCCGPADPARLTPTPALLLPNKARPSSTCTHVAVGLARPVKPEQGNTGAQVLSEGLIQGSRTSYCHETRNPDPPRRLAPYRQTHRYFGGRDVGIEPAVHCAHLRHRSRHANPSRPGGDPKHAVRHGVRGDADGGPDLSFRPADAGTQSGADGIGAA